MSKGYQSTFGNTQVVEAEKWATCDKRVQNNSGKYRVCNSTAVIKIDNEGNIPSYRCIRCARDSHLEMVGLE